MIATTTPLTNGCWSRKVSNELRMCRWSRFKHVDVTYSCFNSARGAAPATRLWFRLRCRALNMACRAIHFSLLQYGGAHFANSSEIRQNRSVAKSSDTAEVARRQCRLHEPQQGLTSCCLLESLKHPLSCRESSANKTLSAPVTAGFFRSITAENRQAASPAPKNIPRKETAIYHACAAGAGLSMWT